jgi:hypothetical protein
MKTKNDLINWSRFFLFIVIILVVNIIVYFMTAFVTWEVIIFWDIEARFIIILSMVCLDVGILFLYLDES